MNKPLLLLTLPLLLLASCKSDEPQYDASGTFEAIETIIPAQANGLIETLTVQEGQSLDSGAVVGYIDSTQLHLKREELHAQIAAILGNKPNIPAQTAALKAQSKHAGQEQLRLTKLVNANAATTKQLDDANAQIDFIKKQIKARQSSLNIDAASFDKKTLPLAIQLKAVNDQLEKCKITNPIRGTVLTKYSEAKEMAAIGKPLYSIADLSTLTLRAYLTGNQFAPVELGQNVKVSVDAQNGKMKTYNGTVEWISSKAEFTPKTVQTKDERANLVYAVKVRVKNDGALKIGMYGEIQLTKGN